MTLERNKLYTLLDVVLIAVAMCSFQTPPSYKNIIVTASVKLYVFDCGTIENTDTQRLGLERHEVAVNRLSVPSFLIVHPKGTLMWDTGVVPDSSWTFTGSPVAYKLKLPTGSRDITLTRRLKTQLTEAGYTPRDITYLALSHYHYDHTANSNDFSSATWLVRKTEYDTMFSAQPPGATLLATYSELRKNKTILIDTDEYDVFGDGTVVIKSAPGHTKGHQVLLVKLKKTGNIVLSGDLYHYPEQKAKDAVPSFDVSAQQTRASRKAIDEFLKTSHAKLWIQHDFSANAKLKKAPYFYE